MRPTEPIGSKSLRDAGALAPSDERRKGTRTKKKEDSILGDYQRQEKHNTRKYLVCDDQNSPA